MAFALSTSAALAGSMEALDVVASRQPQSSGSQSSGSQSSGSQSSGAQTLQTQETTRVARERLYEQHKDRVFHLCLRFGGGNRAWAEDATHDVFINLFENIDTLTDQADLGGWLYRVTANSCYTRLRREGSIWGKVRGALVAESDREDRQTPERRVTVKRELRAALDALASFPPKERVVFTMRYLDDRPQQEIAETLALSKGYVSKLLGRAQARLAKQLHQTGGTR
jgi:RNA polymerase sigma factor (sigma-70 family)